jgi:hypothetical protein
VRYTLNTSYNRYATYDPLFSTYLGPAEADISIISGYVLAFTYKVAATDQAERFHHYDIDALQLNGATIKRKSSNPITDALLLFPSPMDSVYTGGSGLLDTIYSAEVFIYAHILYMHIKKVLQIAYSYRIQCAMLLVR